MHWVFDCPDRMEGWACLVNQKVELVISVPNQHAAHSTVTGKATRNDMPRPFDSTFINAA
jgi:hypothetical protein